MEEIKVKYFSDDVEELCYVAGKSDWIDLSAAEEVCAVLRAYQTGAQPPAKFTRGLWDRGVE